MCTLWLLRDLLGTEIQHTVCLSPTGYSTVLQDPVHCPVPLELPCALACELGLQHSPLAFTVGDLVWRWPAPPDAVVDSGSPHPAVLNAQAGKSAQTADHVPATTGAADGERLRFFWIDRVSPAGVRRLSPFGDVAATYRCQTTKTDAAG